MHIRAQRTVCVCVNGSQKGDGNLGALWEVLLLSCHWGEEDTFPIGRHPYFPVLLLESLVLDASVLEAQLAWGLVFRGSEHLCSGSSRAPRIRGHFWKCWQRHFVLSLHFISLMPKVFHVVFYSGRSLFQINHFQWDLVLNQTNPLW